MAKEFKLPEVSEGVSEADISEIMVAEGDVIEADQVVMEVETEKAVAPVECPYAGKVVKLHVKEGDTVPIGATLLTVEEVGAPASGGGGSKSGAGTQKVSTGGQPAESKAERPAPQKEARPDAANEPAEAGRAGQAPPARRGETKATPAASQRTGVGARAKSVHDVEVEGKDVARSVT